MARPLQRFLLLWLVLTTCWNGAEAISTIVRSSLGSSCARSLTELSGDHDSLSWIYREEGSKVADAAARAAEIKAVVAQVRPWLEVSGNKIEEEPFAEGAFAYLFRGKTASGRSIAIKVLKGDDPVKRELLRGEALLMKDLSTGEGDAHFSRASFRQLVSGGKTVSFIVTEFISERPGSLVPASSVEEMVNRGDFAGKPELVAKVRAQIHDLVAMAHRRGIVHRDLKLANILVRYDSNGEPRVRIVDWGLAARTKETGGSGFPQGLEEGSFSGTPEYSPLDQIMTKPASFYFDVHALRVIDWYLMKALQPDLASPVVARGPGRKAPRAFHAHDLPKDAKGRDVPLRDRFVAMAEWAGWPRTLEARDEILEKARTAEPKSFLKWYGERLGELDGEGPAVAREQAAHEILGSTLLIENFQPTEGLGLPLKTLSEIVMGAYMRRFRYKLNQGEPRVDHMRDPHWDLFLAKVKELHAQNLVDSPESFERQARHRLVIE